MKFYAAKSVVSPGILLFSTLKYQVKLACKIQITNYSHYWSSFSSENATDYKLSSTEYVGGSDQSLMRVQWTCTEQTIFACDRSSLLRSDLDSNWRCHWLLGGNNYVAQIAIL